MSLEPERAARALSFGAAAEDYDRYRPGYPMEAVVWATPTAPASVVDLGAGTGILTRALGAVGHDALPVEPDDGMRAQFARSTRGRAALAGSAEEIPVPDASVDGVVVGQAYHWFDRERAHREIARVLRPGGVFATLWNVRDDSVPWVAELTAIADAERGYRGADDHAPGSFGPLFGPLERAEFAHATIHTPGSLVELMKTRAWYRTAMPRRRIAVEQAVIDLVARHLNGRDEFALPYVTVAFRAYRA
jgi:SAM-dependent methyltransferase